MTLILNPENKHLIDEWEKKRYRQHPKTIGYFEVEPTEMMFYQDMLIKDKRTTDYIFEKRLEIFRQIIMSACTDFINEFGIEKYINSYVYVSAKYLFQPEGKPFNRPGWHCDGFMHDDINYVWSDVLPTVFNFSEFNLTQDHAISMYEMSVQANPENDFIPPNNTLVRLNQYVVHRVNDVSMPGFRCFCKVSFSKDKYNLKGNTHNHLIDYNWPLIERQTDRNVPHKP